MKVYLVWEFKDVGEYDVIKVFADKEKAEVFAEYKKLKENPDNNSHWEQYEVKERYGVAECLSRSEIEGD